MSATWVTFLFEAANFLLLAAVLGWLFFRPVRDALERRRSEFERQQETAAEARVQAEDALAEARAHRAELEDSLEKLRARVEQEAEKERDRVLESARAQNRRERETLDAELAALRRERAGTLARDAAFAATRIVVRLLEQIEGPELEQSLHRAACHELERLRSSGSLAPVMIESARPLDEAALQALAGAAGVGSEDANARVDRELVAGLRISTARGVVDVSAAGLGAEAERVLRGRLEGGEPP